MNGENYGEKVGKGKEGKRREGKEGGQCILQFNEIHHSGRLWAYLPLGLSYSLRVSLDQESIKAAELRCYMKHPIYEDTHL